MKCRGSMMMMLKALEIVSRVYKGNSNVKWGVCGWLCNSKKNDYWLV